MRSLGHFTFLDQPPVNLVRLAPGAGFDFVGLRFHPPPPGQLHHLPDAPGLATLITALPDDAKRAREFPQAGVSGHQPDARGGCSGPPAPF